MNHKLSNLLLSSGILLIQGAAMAQKVPDEVNAEREKSRQSTYSEIQENAAGIQVAWFDSSCTTNSGCQKPTA